MPKYNEGKVYKLVLPDKRIYIGCTTSSLTKKLYQHKKNNKPILNNWDGVKIILIENVTCECTDQLKAREYHYRELLNPSL